MSYTYRVLREDMDFFAAALSQERVSVWQVLEEGEQLMDYGGPIEEYSPFSIKIMGERYFRSVFEFRLTPSNR
ncbi:hypothetical protein PAECIP112173_00327 [Paenibacillus sp. JJ-100]|nr:hypothetical protein [Paenibacillus sp. JJ-100]CAI6023035.1 hypothetical protein PAECIP112173_00327 [Paenibacillus sp. JJ-100]